MNTMSHDTSLRLQLAAVFPRVYLECPDPQCGDSTWDHECELGGVRLNVEQADQALMVFARLLRAEASTLREKAKVADKHNDDFATFTIVARLNTVENLIQAVIEGVPAEVLMKEEPG